MAGIKAALVGKIPNLKQEDASRLGVYVVRGSEILAQGEVSSEGAFRIPVARAFATADSNYGIEAVIGPAGMSGHLSQVPELLRIPINKAELAKTDILQLSTDRLVLNPDILGIWWRWCRLYCVSGTVIGPHGCPVPGAQVTVNTVSHTLGGYSKTPQVTVNADENGYFTACFNWCTCGICRFCWPCWPHWWFCWPWWWELDMLHIIDNIEQIPIQIGPVGPGPVEGLRSAVA